MLELQSFAKSMQKCECQGLTSERASKIKNVILHNFLRHEICVTLKDFQVMLKLTVR